MIDLTVVILTKNEEENIQQVINNAKKCADYILVVDSGSTDKTVELAKSAGAQVVYRAWDNDFSAQRNFALDKVETEWVLYLDADERLTESLIVEIKKVIDKNKQALYQFERRTSAFGKDFKYGVLSPDYVKRMFPVKDGKWQGKVHEAVYTELPVVNLNGYIKHNTYKTFEQYIHKMNIYSTIWAENSNKKVNFIKDIVLRPLFAFFKMYIIQLGVLEGWLGFVLSVNYSLYTLNKYVKLKIKRG